MSAHRKLKPLTPVFPWLSILWLMAWVVGCSPVTISSESRESNLQSTATQKAEAGNALVMNQPPVGGGWEVFPIDLADGTPVEGVKALRTGWEVTYAFSPDRSAVAVFHKSIGCSKGCLTVYRLANFTRIAQIAIPFYQGYNDWISQIVFSLDNNRLAVFTVNDSHGKLAVVDMARLTTGHALVGIIDLEINPRMAAFTSNGSGIMLIGGYSTNQTTTGANPTTRAQLISAETLEVTWQQDLEEVKDGLFGSGDHSQPTENILITAGIAPDPANNRILIAHADEDRLTTVDFGLRQARSIAILPPRSLLDRFLTGLLSIGVKPVQAKVMNSVVRQAVLSTDGKVLYVAGMKTDLIPQENDELMVVNSPLGLQAWEIETGGLLARNADLRANELHLAPDGSLLLSYWDGFNPDISSRLQRVDPATLDVLAETEQSYAVLAPRLDGTQALLAASIDGDRTERLGLLDLETLAPVFEWENRMSKSIQWLSIR